MFSHALTFNGEVSRMCFIVIDDFYGQTHLSLQVSLNVRDFVWVLFHFFFFKQKLCTGHDGFDSALCAADFWFGLKYDLF